MAHKPILEADPIEIADHLHGCLVVHQAQDDRARAQGEGIAELVEPIQLGRGEKGLQTIEGGPNREAKIQFP